MNDQQSSREKTSYIWFGPHRAEGAWVCMTQHTITHRGHPTNNSACTTASRCAVLSQFANCLRQREWLKPQTLSSLGTSKQHTPWSGVCCLLQQLPLNVDKHHSTFTCCSRGNAQKQTNQPTNKQALAKHSRRAVQPCCMAQLSACMQHDFQVECRCCSRRFRQVTY